MNYTIENDLYKANEGYIFRNKNNWYTCSIMKLANTDSIDNYEVIEKPIEEITEENPTYEELLEMYNKQTFENSENQAI